MYITKPIVVSFQSVRVKKRKLYLQEQENWNSLLCNKFCTVNYAHCLLEFDINWFDCVVIDFVVWCYYFEIIDCTS